VLRKASEVHLWSGSRQPARIYLTDETTIPRILLSDGTDPNAMLSVAAMKDVDEA